VHPQVDFHFERGADSELKGLELTEVPLQSGSYGRHVGLARAAAILAHRLAELGRGTSGGTRTQERKAIDRCLLLLQAGPNALAASGCTLPRWLRTGGCPCRTAMGRQRENLVLTTSA
jgi:hypothetical protein